MIINDDIVYDYTINGVPYRTKRLSIVEAFDEINNRIKHTFDAKSIDIRVTVYKNDELTKKCRVVKTLTIPELFNYHNREYVWFKTYIGEEFRGVICDMIPYDKKLSSGDWVFIPIEKLERFKKLSNDTKTDLFSKIDKIGVRMDVLDITEIKLIDNGER